MLNKCLCQQYAAFHQIPEPVNTLNPNHDTSEAPSCYRWDEITLEMAGEKVCVYGKAYSHQVKAALTSRPRKTHSS